MAKKETIDFDNMSDEDFLKLDESDFSGNVEGDETDLTNVGEPKYEQEQSDDQSGEEFNSSDDDSEFDNASGNSVPDSSESNQDEEDEQEADLQADPMAGEGEDANSQEAENEQGNQSESESEETSKETKSVKAETPAKAGYFKIPEGMVSEQVDAAIEFFSKISVPFKADGKDITVRSAEDAIRLMQQGVNYSRRMQELKPVKAMNRMLADHGLNDPETLNHLIDLSKGDKGAIAKLLKTHNIDPMDLDIEKESGYQSRNYQGDPQDNEFRDALDMALATPDGQALVNHIHSDWDRVSKAKLRENPSILGNLQNLKASGVYDKVIAELDYQKSMGYLTGVPFLQAFDQVGEAMKNAGVFQEATNNPAQVGSSMAPLKTSTARNQPVASGARKPQAPKKPAANPHLSSTPNSKQVGNTNPKEPDYDKMSDEEFLKMAPPE